VASERGRTRSKIGFSDVWIGGENRGGTRCGGGWKRARSLRAPCTEKRTGGSSPVSGLTLIGSERGTEAVCLF
jgi:hypothetical protein